MNEELRAKAKESLSKYSDLEYSDEQIDGFFGISFCDIANAINREILIDNLTEKEEEAAVQGAYALGLRDSLLQKAKENANFGEKDFSLDITPEIKNLVDRYNEEADKFLAIIEELKKIKPVIEIKRK
jgi:hypothetical protein